MTKHHIGRILPAVLIAITVAGMFLLFSSQVANAFSENKACFEKTRESATFSDSEAKDQAKWSKFIEVTIPIPGLTQKLYCYDSLGNNTVDLKSLAEIQYVEDLGSYLAGMYRFFVSIVGILAAVMIMYGGIRWILAAGNASRIQGAKDVIFSAIIGVVIAFCSYLLLYLLNPRLINYELLSKNLKSVAPIAQSSSFCKDVPNPELYDFQLTQAGPERGQIDISSITEKKLCGDRYAIITKDVDERAQASKAPTCYGDVCNGVAETCRQLGPLTFNCEKTYLRGDISWVGNAYIDWININAVCKDGTKPRFTTTKLINNLEEGVHSYAFPIAREGTTRDLTDVESLGVEARELLDLARSCSGVPFPALPNESMKYTPQDLNNFGGFYISIEVNDDTSLGFTWDDTFAIGDNCLPISLKSHVDITDEEWESYSLNGKLIPFTAFFSNDGSVWQINKTKYCNFDIDRNLFTAR